MELKLRENDHKGGWEGCDLAYFLLQITVETDELRKSLQDKLLPEAILECADIANYAMMLASNCKVLNSER